MRFLIFVILLQLTFNSYCQTDLRKKQSKQVFSIYNKDSLLKEFDYYKVDSIICHSILDTLSKREVFIYVDKMPKYGENIKELSTYINKNLKYPVICDYDVQGRVIVGFIVEIDGTISNTRILKSVDKLLDDEALRLVQNMSCWKPGECNNYKVPVFYMVPISFHLGN